MLILLLVLATVNSLFYPSVSRFQRAATGALAPITVHLQPTSTTPYMATFRITKNPGTLSPWVLYPQNDKTVWVVALGGGPPFVSQIINFTLSPQPQEEIVLNLTNALPSSILVDNRSERVWFPVNDTIAYYDPTTRIVNRTAVVYRGGAPQFLAQDKLGRLWVTLDGSNQIAMFDPSTQLGRNFTVPTPRAVIQGIAVAPDSTIWFTEAQAGKLGRLDPNTGNFTEYSPPIKVVAPIQLAVGLDGVVWFTDHGSNEFGSFNPKTGEWNKFPIGYCQGTYCSIGLPNAINVDSTGEVWFSEHLPGRVARYDPRSRALTEYIIPAPPEASSLGLPYTWWASPGPGNLVWFTSYGFGEVGYVNASVPVSLSISATQELAIPEGSSRNVQTVLASTGQRTVTVGVSSSRLDYAGDIPLLSGSLFSSTLAGPGTTRLGITIAAGWGVAKGAHYVMVTALDGQIAVSVPVRVNVTENLLPYWTLALDLSVFGAAIIVYARPRHRNIPELAPKTSDRAPEEGRVSSADLRGKLRG